MNNIFVQNTKPKKSNIYKTATVISFNATYGATLKFAGELTNSSKRYKVNKNISSLAYGDRVAITKVSGTYIVDYKL